MADITNQLWNPFLLIPVIASENPSNTKASNSQQVLTMAGINTKNKSYLPNSSARDETQNIVSMILLFYVDIVLRILFQFCSSMAPNKDLWIDRGEFEDTLTLLDIIQFLLKVIADLQLPQKNDNEEHAKWVPEIIITLPRPGMHVYILSTFTFSLVGICCYVIQNHYELIYKNVFPCKNRRHVVSTLHIDVIFSEFRAHINQCFLAILIEKSLCLTSRMYL